MPLRGKEAPMDVDAFNRTPNDWVGRLEHRRMNEQQGTVPMDEDPVESAAESTLAVQMELDAEITTSLSSKSQPNPTPYPSSPTMTASNRSRPERAWSPLFWDQIMSKSYVLPHLIYTWANLIYQLSLLSILTFGLFKIMQALYNDYQMKFLHFNKQIPTKQINK